MCSSLKENSIFVHIFMIYCAQENKVCIIYKTELLKLRLYTHPNEAEGFLEFRLEKDCFKGRSYYCAFTLENPTCSATLDSRVHSALNVLSSIIKYFIIYLYLFIYIYEKM